MDQLQEVRSRFDGQSGLQEQLEPHYEVWKQVPRWAHRLVHIRAAVAVNWYMVLGFRHADMFGDTEITKYRPARLKLTAGLQNLSGCTEGQYGVNGAYCDVAADLVALQPKIRPLEHCRFCGAGTLIALIACPIDIHRNLAPWKQNLC